MELLLLVVVLVLLVVVVLLLRLQQGQGALVACNAGLLRRGACRLSQQVEAVLCTRLWAGPLGCVGWMVAAQSAGCGGQQNLSGVCLYYSSSAWPWWITLREVHFAAQTNGPLFRQP